MDKRISITKQFVLSETRPKIVFILRTEMYDDRLSYFLDLFEEAKKDFPDLVAKQVKALKYGGDTHKGQRGIEFTFDLPYKIPDGYIAGIKLIDTA